MIYRITFQKTGGKNQKLASRVKDRQELLALRNAQSNLEVLQKVRGGNTEVKSQLLQLAYNLGHAEGLIAGTKSIGSFFFHDVDCYDSSSSDEIRDLILSKKDEIGLRMLERSASGGWHLVCDRKRGTTILENQVRIATVLHLEMDTNTKDLQRVVFSTSGSEQDLVYLDDAIFTEPMSAEECLQEYAQLKERERQQQENVPAGAKKADKHYRPWEDGSGSKENRSTDNRIKGANPKVQKSAEQNSPSAEQSPQPIEANERTRFIFRECMREEGIVDADLIKEGGRHNSVKMILGQCNQLLSREETLGVLRELMPQNWQDDNIQQLVSAYYTDYYNPSQRLTLAQKRIFRESKRMGADAQADQTPDTILGQPQGELSRIFAAKTPPEIPETLPRLVKLVTSRTPKKFKATVAQAMFPPLATYPKDLSFVYVDNQVRELRINCLIIAGTGQGKDSCTKEPLTHILSDMKQRDEVNRKRLKDYNEEYNNKANNKQKPQRPDDLVIQIIKANITYAALVQRMDEAKRAPLYVKMNELEQWDKVEGCSGRSNQFTNMKLCDDEGNEFGADRASTQSVMASGALHLNWNANTTTAKALKYFRYVVSDGPISRLCLATIPDGEIGEDIPVYGEYDSDYDKELKPYIDNLKAATGTIDCLQAKKMVKRLKAECAEFARLSQDEVFDNLTHRALVQAFRKACLLFAANGMKWEKAIDDFCRWSMLYDLYLKMKLWGDQIREADGEVMVSKRGPQNLLDLLPTKFTLEDAKRVRQLQGMRTDQTKKMIRNWVYRNYVTQNSELSFEKAQAYIDKTNKK